MLVSVNLLEGLHCGYSEPDVQFSSVHFDLITQHLHYIGGVNRGPGPH